MGRSTFGTALLVSAAIGTSAVCCAGVASATSPEEARDTACEWHGW